MSSVIGSQGLDVLIPEGVDPSRISVATDAEGIGRVLINKVVSGLEIKATEESTVIRGRKLSDSTVTAKAGKGELSDVSVKTREFNGGTVENKGRGLLNVVVEGTNFKNSTIDAGANKKRADNISFEGKAKVNKSVIKAGKGNDEILFGDKVKFKGKTTIDLGKGGKDSIIIEADSIPKGGKLVVTNFTKKDTITVGDERFTYKDIKNGAEIPNIKVKLV